MSDYNNPRPQPSASASDPCTIVDNAISFDKVINGDSTVTTYTGKQILSLSQAIDKFGFGVAQFTFTNGGTLESKNLLVSNDPVDGFLYKYIGAGSFPLTVTAGTNPTVGSDWQPFAATDHNLLSNRNASGAHDEIYRRRVTVDQVLSGEFESGTRLTLIDRDNAPFCVKNTGVADGYASISAGGGKVAVVEPIAGSIAAEWCGCVGDVNHQEAAQSWVNYTASIRCKAVTNGLPRLNLTGLKIPPFADIDFGYTEPYLLDGSNSPIFENSVISFSSRQVLLASIRGKVAANCNEAGQDNVDENGTLLSGVRFVGAKFINFNIPVKSAARYHVWLINVDGFISDTLEITSTHVSGYPNTDGLHINGNCLNIYVNNLIVNGCHDDSLAINADDVDHGGGYTQLNVSGHIKNVQIGTLTVGGGGWQCLRLLSATKNINNVKIGSIKGEFARHAVLAENYGLGTGGVYQDVVIEDINLSMIDISGVTENNRFIWLDCTGNNFSYFKFGRIVRQQVGTLAASRGENTLVQKGGNVSVEAESVTEVSCGNVTGAELIKTAVGGTLICDIGKWTRLYSTVTSGTNVLTCSGVGTIESVSFGTVISDGYANFIKLHGGVQVNLATLKSSTVQWSDVLASIDNSKLVKLVTNGSYLTNGQLYALINGGIIGTAPEISVAQILAGQPRPSNPIYGLWYYDNNTGYFIYFNGSAWQKVTHVPA